MKKIVYRKLLADCLFFSLIVLFGLSSIIWVFQAVNFLDIMIEDGRNYNVYFFYTLLNFPKIISKILPFCIFFGFSYIFIKYEMRNELIIYWNHGIEKMSLINFFVSFSLIILFFQLILLTIIVPKSQEISRNLLRTSDVDYFEGLIKPKKFNDNIKDLTIFADEKNLKNEFINIYIKKKTAPNRFQITFAKKGVFEQRGAKKILVLFDGRNLTSNNNDLTNFSFSKSDFDLGNMESHFLVNKKLQEQSTKELIKCIERVYLKIQERLLNCDLNNPKNVYKELFKRLVIPLYLPLLILISSAIFLVSKESVNYFKFRFLILLVGVLVIILSETSLGFISNYLLINIFFIILPLFLILTIYMIFLSKLKLNVLNL